MKEAAKSVSDFFVFEPGNEIKTTWGQQCKNKLLSVLQSGYTIFTEEF